MLSAWGTNKLPEGETAYGLLDTAAKETCPVVSVTMATSQIIAGSLTFQTSVHVRLFFQTPQTASPNIHITFSYRQTVHMVLYSPGLLRWFGLDLYVMCNPKRFHQLCEVISSCWDLGQVFCLIYFCPCPSFLYGFHCNWTSLLFIGLNKGLFLLAYTYFLLCYFTMFVKIQEGMDGFLIILIIFNPMFFQWR